MKKQEAIIISAYTGFLLTKKFSDMHEFAEETLGRPIMTHEFAEPKLFEELREKLKPRIVEIIKAEEE